MGGKNEGFTFTRRQFLKASLVTGAAVSLGGANVFLRPGVAHAAVFAQSPQLTKWSQAIRNLDILTAAS